MSVQSNHSPASQTATTQSSFCQAMFFFYTCGCRTPEPVFCCQPPTHLQKDIGNPCRHEKPALVVAKLPLACGRRLGNSKACGVEDPSAKEFVREVDTAERLELVVSEDFKQDTIHNALPGKVEGGFTVDEVVAKSQRAEKCRSIFSATATPFVPRLGGCGMGMESTTVGGDGAETADKTSHETAGNTPVDDAETSVNGAATDRAEQDQGVQPDEKTGSQPDSVLAEEKASDQTTRHTEPRDDSDDKDAPEEFHDIELRTPTLEHTAPDEEPNSSTSTAEQTVKNEGLEAPAQQEDSYDDLLALWALDDRKARPKPTRTCWSITSLF
ncbi:hypothetical protein F4824DRAFT_341570 [Ustulina deusta]|nr:hypothetical protein F4824DRAFT_341570 [Ustulina deusta]